MKKVITVGVFDYFHLGHLILFENAKKYGDYLIVAVQEGDSILKTKPNATKLYTTEQRIYLIKALNIVDEVITYKDVDSLIPTIEFDVFAVGEEQNHAGFKRAIRWCEAHDKEVIRIPRTPGISSSDIKNTLRELL